jgi:hypothetical protein
VTARDPTPLDEARRQKAIETAGRHDELKGVLEGKSDVVFVKPNLTGRGEDAGADRAVVGVYDYDRNRSLVALVDPDVGEVVDVVETPAQFQLSRAERERAEALASDDARVGEFLAGRRPNPLTRLYFPPPGSAHDPDHRYAIVFLRPSNAVRRYAVVDLSSDDVVDVLDSLAASMPGGQ